MYKMIEKNPVKRMSINDLFDDEWLNLGMQNLKEEMFEK